MPERIYISGPISGHEQAERQKYFNDVRAGLAQAGYEGVNPFDLHPLDASWENAMKADLQELCRCDSILMLPGWEESRGAKLEMRVALELGLRIYFLGDPIPGLVTKEKAS